MHCSEANIRFHQKGFLFFIFWLFFKQKVYFRILTKITLNWHKTIQFELCWNFILSKKKEKNKKILFDNKKKQDTFLLKLQTKCEWNARKSTNRKPIEISKGLSSEGETKWIPQRFSTILLLCHIVNNFQLKRY